MQAVKQDHAHDQITCINNQTQDEQNVPEVGR